MRNRKRNVIILILGKTGCGKTTLAKGLFSHLRRCVVFDPMLDDYKADVVESFEPFLSYMEQHHADKNFHIACRFKSLDDYKKAIALIREIKHLWLFIEELNWFIDCYSRDEDFNDLIRFARHDGISLVCIAQRAAEIPKLYTSQSQIIVSFRQTEPRDLAYLASVSFIGDKGAERLSKLLPIKNPTELSENNFLVFYS